ncbi:centromere protein N [Mytilus galloprovincialis]|uniref:Centromere protein N n=1 Tax=Mytilus galloprovincialis TaxID=29158 RepID=A0A8B6C7R4_MYTGA|nr:centromere protein N [Mytilus galloprovincialis]
MQKQLLGHVVSRTRTKDLKPILERWGWLEQEVEQIDLSKTKREITNSLIEVCNQKEGLTRDVCGELDLICTQEYSTKKQWSVFLMEKDDEHYISDSNLSNPLKLKKKLKIDDMQPFRCRVKFEGPSVIDGIRNLAECGLVTMPYPKYLRSVHTLGKNHIKLADKTAMQHNVSQVNQSHAEQNENTPAKNTRSRSKPRTKTRT